MSSNTKYRVVVRVQNKETQQTARPNGIFKRRLFKNDTIWRIIGNAGLRKSRCIYCLVSLFLIKFFLC